MDLIISLAVFFLAIIVHEVAHGWVAYKRGDPTAKFAGRLTLNPLAHIDPFGTILMPLFLIMARAPFLFGWAKPVPVNFSGLKNPKKDIILVGAAGPTANIIIAIMVSLLLRLHIWPLGMFFLLRQFIQLNLTLAVFNLIPVPPLDGSRIVAGLLPNYLAYQYIKLERYGFLLIYLMVYLGIFHNIVWPIVNILERIIR